MPKNNIDELMSVALDKWIQTELPTLNQATTAGIGGEASLPDISAERAAIENELKAIRTLAERSQSSGNYTGSTDVSAIAELQAGSQIVVPAVTTEEKTTSKSSEKHDDSTATSILKVASMVTGLGPLIGGLVGLFGSGDDEPVLAPQTYTAPERVNVEAGLDRSGTFTSISYGLDGVARSAPQTSSQPRVEIHVQAMDSRSFLDHSDEIARAVQTAMLRSHSLNDVVAEL